MKKSSNRPGRALQRAVLIASTGAAVMLSQSGCGGSGSGLLGKSKADGDDGALVASDEPKRKGSIFKRAKARNAWIDEDIQTTRRDRFAAQNSATFLPTDEGPGAMADTIPAPTTQPGAGTSLPNDDFDPDLAPDPVLNEVANTSLPQLPDEGSLRLPTSLDDDFPQPNSPNTIDPPTTPSAAARTRQDDDGYTPLQPRLPSAEPIQPPSE